MESKMMEKMKNAVAWFEIPVNNLDRAKRFYEGILDIELIDMDLGDEFKMSMFPVVPGGVSGAICKHKEYYKPSKEGTLVYLNAEPNLQSVLDRVINFGGKVLQEKTPISDEYGFMAILQDTEGNRIALHSSK
ncbi:VOC family protein [Fodinibius saliphilus]|uniref:VOC family protein n=1 Tax=Fodinibius saliphilus TaxID=1920650 RepID=UPI001FE56BB8|nr:VOC family protein [Fodinibius saliphilus]